MIDLTGVKHHPAIEEIVTVLCNKTQNTDRGFFRTATAYFLAKMAATMRASVITKDRGEVPVNLYVMNLATSGFGKGHSVFLLENEFLGAFKRRFMEHSFELLADKKLWDIANDWAIRSGKSQQEEYDRVVREFQKQGPYPFTFDSGTVPAIKQLRQKLLMADVGAVNLQIDEIGSNLVNSTEILTLYLELFDQGMTKQKLVKNTQDNQRGEDYDGKTPTNMMLFGTPSKLLDGSSTEDAFYSMLETGYARRCLFGYGQHQHNAFENMTPEQIWADLIKQDNVTAINTWAMRFHDLADPAMFKWKMDMEDEVGIQLLTYKIECEKAAIKLADHEEIKKAELMHRYFKVLKLSGALAFVDKSPEVEMDHLMSAILLVEESGTAFQKILNREKPYVKLAKYMAAVKSEQTHADLLEALPFYKPGVSARNEMMSLATAWGYKNHIIIKKSFVDGIEIYEGETIEETDLNGLILSYSDHWAYNYTPELAPFDHLHVLTQLAGHHWANHHFDNEHRSEENAQKPFNMIVIDVDGTISLAAAHELMKEYKFMTYTTKRHTDAENRFRMIFPMNYTLKLDSEEYKAFMNAFLAWLPFDTDPSSNQRAKKWETFDGGSYHYNLEGDLIDILPFIPKTSRNESYQNQTKELQSLDNLERWFAQQMVTGNRNNSMIRFALALVDSGFSLPDVNQKIDDFNKKLSDPLSEEEISMTIKKTVAKQYQPVSHS